LGNIDKKGPGIKNKMNNDERLRFKKIYEEMPDEALIKRMLEGEDEYTSGAYELLVKECKKRNILERPGIKERIEESEKKIKKNKKKNHLQEEELKERKKPTNLKVGGGILVFISAINILIGAWGIATDSVAFGFGNIIFGIIFLGLGIGAIKNLSWCLYVGLIVWVFDFLVTTCYYLLHYSEQRILMLAVIVKAWLAWELIKATPLYKRFYCRRKELSNK